jgi:uncharacterized protein (TIGR03067 family)
MIVQALAIVALLGVVNRPVVKKDPAKEEAKQLEGTWRVVMMEVRGRQYPEDRLRRLNYQVLIQGREFTYMIQGRKRNTMHFKLDPSSKPKAIDLLPAQGQGRATLAIYHLEGDTLKICQATTANQRPTEFTTQGQILQSVMILKREKP